MKTIHFEMFISNIIAKKLYTFHTNKQNLKNVDSYEGFDQKGDTREIFFFNH
jgi:hypothetical protein